MNQKAIENYKKGKQCRKVTHLPNFILKIKGKLDVSRKESIAHTYINGLYDECLVIEAYEVSKAEKLLQDYRKEGLSHFYKVKHYAFYTINLSKKDPTEKQREHKEFRASMERLYAIHKIIEGVNTALEQRILDMRTHCSRKIDAYTRGIKSVSPDFYPVTYYYEKSVDEYLSKHKATDYAIARFVLPPLNQDEILGGAL